MKKVFLISLLVCLVCISTSFSQDYNLPIKAFSNQVLRSILNFEFKNDIERIGIYFEKTENKNDRIIISLIEKNLVEKISSIGYTSITNQSRDISLEELEFNLSVSSSSDTSVSDLKQLELVALLSIIVEHDSISIYCTLINVQTSEIVQVESMVFSKNNNSAEIVKSLLPDKVYISTTFESPFSINPVYIFGKGTVDPTVSFMLKGTINYETSNNFILRSSVVWGTFGTKTVFNDISILESSGEFGFGFGLGYSIPVGTFLRIPIVFDSTLGFSKVFIQSTPYYEGGIQASYDSIIPQFNLGILPSFKIYDKSNLIFILNALVTPAFPKNNYDNFDIGIVMAIGIGFSFAF